MRKLKITYNDGSVQYLTPDLELQKKHGTSPEEYLKWFQGNINNISKGSKVEYGDD